MAKRRKRRPADQPDLVRHDGGLCSNFVNTASGKRPPIRSYGDLLLWGQRSGVLGAADAQRLERQARERPADAEAVFAPRGNLASLVLQRKRQQAQGSSRAAWTSRPPPPGIFMAKESPLRSTRTEP